MAICAASYDILFHFKLLSKGVGIGCKYNRKILAYLHRRLL